jgi:hypothetical protein
MWPTKVEKAGQPKGPTDDSARERIDFGLLRTSKVQSNSCFFFVLFLTRIIRSKDWHTKTS